MDKLIHPQKVRYLNPVIYDLKEEEELRIYGANNGIKDFVRVRLLEGWAEVFGRELPNNETVFFYKG